MSIEFPVITICGSMKFYHSYMLWIASELTLDGFIVLMPHAVIPGRDQLSQTKKMLDKMHRRKIDMADGIAVVSDLKGYYGESTAAEINYAKSCGKPVTLYRGRLLTEEL